MVRITAVLVMVLAAALPAAAQAGREFPRVSLDLTLGFAGFIDETLIGHTVIGGSVRYQLTPRLSVGPELVYMVGPGSDRDLFLTGNATFDFRVRPPDRRAGLISPFLVVGGGVMHHRDRIGPNSFSHVEGALTGGAGARVWINDRAYAFGEYRVGWEAHVRATGGGGWSW